MVLDQDSEMRPFWIDFENTANPRQAVIVEVLNSQESTMSKPIQVKRLIRREELLRLIPLSDSAIYRLEKSGGFPNRFNLTPRCVVWDLDEVESWIQERRTALIQSQLSPDVQKRKFRPVRKQA